MIISPFHTQTFLERQLEIAEKKKIKQQAKHKATCAKNRSKRKKK